MIGTKTETMAGSRSLSGARRSRLVASIMLASLASALLGVVGLGTPASAASAEIVVDFGDVLPGEVLSAERTFDTPVEAKVVAAEIVAATPSSLGIFRSEVCPAGAGCIPFDAMPGNMLPAGTHTIRVTLEVSDTIAPGAAMSSTWRLSLVEQADELATTGSTAQLGVAAAALLALGAGAFLVGALNRRKGEQR